MTLLETKYNVPEINNMNQKSGLSSLATNHFPLHGRRVKTALNHVRLQSERGHS